MNKVLFDFKNELFNYLKSFMDGGGWHDGNTAEQARAIFTTLCFVCNIDADTMECDRLLWSLYTAACMDEIVEYDDFETFMIELIV